MQPIGINENMSSVLSSNRQVHPQCQHLPVPIPGRYSALRLHESDRVEAQRSSSNDGGLRGADTVTHSYVENWKKAHKVPWWAMKDSYSKYPKDKQVCFVHVGKSEFSIVRCSLLVQCNTSSSHPIRIDSSRCISSLVYCSRRKYNWL